MGKISIKNFQSLKDVSLDVEKGKFTVIVGKSSSGKSAIRRALQVLLYNEWDKSFLRKGEKISEISLDFDGHTISRIKSGTGTKNSYIVNDVEYPKVGIYVPQEFKGLGIEKMSVQDKDYDLIVSSQLDSLFITDIKGTPGTKILNKLFGVEKYEIASKLVQKDLYNKKVELTSLKSSLEVESKLLEETRLIYDKLDSLQTKISFINDLDKVGLLKKQIEDLTLFVDFFNKLVKNQNSLSILLAFINKIEEIDKLKGLIKIEKDVVSNYQNMVNSLERFDHIKFSINQIRNFRDRILEVSKIKEEIKVESDLVASMSNMNKSVKRSILIAKFINKQRDLDIIKSEISEVSGKIDLYKNAVDLLNQLNDRHEKLNELNNLTYTLNTRLTMINTLKDTEIPEISEKVTQYQGEYDRLIKEVCPTCGRKFDV